jgi:hypothetical protein
VYVTPYPDNDAIDFFKDGGVEVVQMLSVLQTS